MTPSDDIFTLSDGTDARTLNLTSFDALDDAVPFVPSADPVAEFIDAMREFGMKPGKEGIIADDQKHRCDIIDDPRGAGDGEYRLDVSPDGFAAGWVFNYKTEALLKWHSKSGTAHVLTDAEKEAIKRKREDAERLAEERKQDRLEYSMRLWDAAEKYSNEHPYLVKKRIDSLPGCRQKDGVLMVPATQGGKIVCYQRIWPPEDERDKMYCAGWIKGSTYTFGGATGTIAICEGVATAYAVNKSTGWKTIVAFDAGSLKMVAEAVRKEHAAATIIVAGDNDETGVGQDKASEAAGDVSGIAVWPDKTNADWWDIWNDEGPEAVKAALTPKQAAETGDGFEVGEIGIKVDPLPDGFLTPDDCFGRFVRAVEASQRRPNTITAFVAVASFISTIAGGAFSGMSIDDRLRFFAIVTGGTGTGKETAISGPGKIAANVYDAVGEASKIDSLIFRFIATPPGSAEGLEEILTNERDIFLGWDEVAQDLKDMRDGKSSNKAQLLNKAVSLHGRADSIYSTRSKAGQSGQHIHAPNLTLVCASVEEKLANSMSADFVTDGSGARFIMFPANAYAGKIRRQAGKLSIPEDILDNISLIFSRNMGHPVKDRTTNPIRIMYTDDADDLLFGVSQEQDRLDRDSLEAGIASRRPVNVKAMACIRALINDPENPVVTEDVAQWAIDLIKWCDSYKMRMVTEKLSLNEWDAAEKAVIARLKRGKRPVPARDLHKVYAVNQLKGNKDKMLTGMVSSGLIEDEVRIAGNGKSVTYYKLSS